MQKLPEVFEIHFRREGVMHQISQLADPSFPICSAPSPKANPPLTSTPPHNLDSNSLDFDNSMASTSKGSSSHVKNFNISMGVNNKTPTVPSTSGSLLQPSKASSPSGTFALNLNASANKVASNSQGGSNLPSSSNGTLLMSAIYNGSPICESNLMRTYNPVLHGGNIFTGNQSTSLFQPSLPHTAQESQLLTITSVDPPPATVSVRSGASSKVSDILKRKVPPKRKSQHNSKSKTRSEDNQSEACTSGSVVQDLFNKASNLGATNRSGQSSTSSRSRFSSSKTSSFLASLNPVRWGRTSSSNAPLSGPNSTAKDSFNMSVSSSNLLAAGNREKARQWIRDQSISFVNRYRDSTRVHPTLNILALLTAAIQKLEGSLEKSLEALEELRNILLESDISPFEVNHSGLIKAMVNYMTKENGNVSRNDRLRSFIFIFAGLPLDGKYDFVKKVLFDF
jgi:E3 ubiquitin-protein ligase TRIP12